MRKIILSAAVFSLSTLACAAPCTVKKVHKLVVVPCEGVSAPLPAARPVATPAPAVARTSSYVKPSNLDILPGDSPMTIHAKQAAAETEARMRSGR
jgi:hypothetical protein